MLLPRRDTARGPEGIGGAENTVNQISMATPKLQVLPKSTDLPGGDRSSDIYRRAGLRRAALRLLAIERSEEIYPALLEEIVALGFRRALVTTVNFESGQLKPAAALNCSEAFQRRFDTSLYAMENPIVSSLHSLTPVVIPATSKAAAIYCHPVLYRNSTLCWEAERERRTDCIALLNFHQERKFNLQEQVCAVCNMRAYMAQVAVELPAKPSDAAIAELKALIELANRYLSRLFKVEHYYNRMYDMEIIIDQMDTVMKSMSEPVILTDGQHRVIMQNKAAEKFFKVPEPEELGGEVSAGAAHAVELNNLLFSAMLSSMAVSGSDDPHDLTLVDIHEGEEKLFEALCARTYSKDGARGGLVTVMRDVTDLRRADEELRENLQKLADAEEVLRQDRDRLNLIVENVGDPIVVCNNAAKVVVLDALAQELFGPMKDPMRDPLQLQNQAKFDAFIMGFTFSFEGKQEGRLQLVNPRTLAEIEYDVKSGKIYDERGQVAYTVTVLRDLTAFRKVEQLKMERRMLEVEKFAATGRLAGTLAHEVNNPLEAIKNAIFLVQDYIMPDGREAYDILRNETERVGRIVRQMLGLYRAGAQAGNVDINAVVDDTLLLFQRQLERSGLTIVKELGVLPPVVGSADQFRQVLTNLVVNAQDSMSAGGKLVLKTRHIPSPDGLHGLVRVIVADTGTGIPRALLKTVFEPFVTTKGERGTGLGLFIVKGIVENHSGRLKVRSKESKGTVFKIDLPVVR